MDINDPAELLKMLPRTKDGYAIVPGMTLYWFSATPKTSTEGIIVHQVDSWLPGKDDDGFNGNIWWMEKNNNGTEELLGMPDDFGLYATKEALEKSQHETK